MLRDALSRLASIGLPIVVANRPSSDAFEAFLRGLPRTMVVTPQQPGLVAQIGCALEACEEMKTPYVLYTEPDKADFFDRLCDFIDRAPPRQSRSITLAARTREAFETFPPMQRYAEGVANELCARFCGSEGDYTYGPFLIAKALLPLLKRAELSLGWGWRPFMFRQATELGWQIVHVAGNFECPLDQRDEPDADRIHRLRQLQQNIHGLIA